MERRQLHPVLIWLAAGSFIGWGVSRIGFAFAHDPAIPFSVAIACPIAAVAIYGLYAGKWRRFLPRIAAIATSTVAVAALAITWIAADLCGEYALLSRPEQLVIALGNQPGCAVGTVDARPFRDWPWPVSRISYSTTTNLELPTNVFTAHAADIQSLHNLCDLALTGGDVTDAVLDDLARLSEASLFGLEFRGVKLSGSSFERLSALPDLTHLGIVDSKFSSEDTALLESISSLPDLQTLTLTGTPIDNAALDAISGLQDLDRLRLARTQIDDSAAKSILALRSLKSLDVSETRMTAKGLLRLAQHSRLTDITVDGIPMDLEMLASLHQVNPRLVIRSDATLTPTEPAGLYESGRYWAGKAVATHNPEDIDTAALWLSKAIELAPTSAILFASRGWLFQDARKFPAAEQDFTKAIELDANKVDFWATRAEIRLRLKNCQSAIDDATHAIDLDSSCEYAFSTRGRARLELGEPRAAIDDFNAALKLAPDLAFDLYWRGKAHLAIEDWDSAIRDFTAAVEREPMATDAYAGRAAAYEQTGQPALAEQDRRQAQRLREVEKVK
jgi:tetratricopeptide (TPR) repeat protein